MIQLFSFDSVPKLVAEFSEFLINEINRAKEHNEKLNLALSGGTTPTEIFRYLSKNIERIPSLNHLHVYWGDERCVPPDNKESNYGNAWREFLQISNIPEINIHRIKGELNPVDALADYDRELSLLPKKNNIPFFDIMMLGIGSDGHTASIFPDQSALLKSREFLAVANHPVSKQKRITLTAKVINNSKKIVFIATGSSKQKVIHHIFNDAIEAKNYPAYFIKPHEGEISWYIDKEALGL